MSRNYKYSSLPSDDNAIPYFTLDYTRTAYFLSSVVCFAFVFCIVWSITFNFYESTNTHCHVTNILPSISAAIGSYSPQKEIWRIAIFINVTPRFFITNFYKKYFEEILSPIAQLFGNIACLFNYFELIALAGLSNWSSTDNYPIHKFCFLTFILTSVVHMIITCYLLQRHRIIPSTNLETLSLKWKWKLFVINISSFLLAAYCFMRHTWYCEPYGLGLSRVKAFNSFGLKTLF
ncbi:post-GPI attachment to proteins factor 2 isoform X2 [Chrysoperla carnea]|uniref:post-GPI attachment to proteins factor 2 isoform X2 n=1 Tax=Chrysoperla carnea TaxID=189513 RepID=UPI001D089ED4|nr:post-GPI attachment to proteins factor 2 isoform X2 [Chrysoperla carnea]